MIDVNNGKIDTQDALKADVQKGTVAFPVLWDDGAKNCTTYGIQGYPASYLVGVDGKVVWEGFALPKVADLEKTLAEELKKVKTERK